MLEKEIDVKQKKVEEEGNEQRMQGERKYLR